MARYGSLLWVQARASLQVAMQYRLDFLIDGAMSLWWVLWSTVPLLIVFHVTDVVAGWTFAEAMVVTAWFTVLRGVLEGSINPSLLTISEQIRSGTLDFVLLKPVDAQFLVSTAKLAPWKVLDVVAGILLAVYAFVRLGHAPALADVALAVAMLVAAMAVLYSIWILVVCAAFWVVRMDNLVFLFSSLFDFARWPLHIFPGAWRLVFTFVIPLGLMTTYPAQAILGRLDARTALLALAGSAVFVVLSRAVWMRAIGRYTSASS